MLQSSGSDLLITNVSVEKGGHVNEIQDNFDRHMCTERNKVETWHLHVKTQESIVDQQLFIVVIQHLMNSSKNCFQDWFVKSFVHHSLWLGP